MITKLLNVPEGNKNMWISPKRYLRDAKGNIVEAGPGVSGTLVVAEGAELPEVEAIKLGLLKDHPRPSSPVSEPIDRSTGKTAIPASDHTTNAVKPIVEGNVAEVLGASLNLGKESEGNDKPWETKPPPALNVDEK